MKLYVPSRFGYQRRVSRQIMVGSVPVGGDAPIMLQSMCTTKTTDVAATVAQSIRMIAVGCQLVRITAPGVADAKALKDIRTGLNAAGYAHVPLVADIHFMPAAALEAIEHVEKVRINPGNFADKKRFAVTDYSDADYQGEVERVRERFLPLVRRAKTLGRALRIGTNHGSLSDRIMNRFGDTPAGMVESALEFCRFCRDEGFHDLCISMKASNPKVMVQAYRLLCARLDDFGIAYPLHLGVTEAGDGEDGRVKSAAGIGSLLEDGIGDTIRVSLTEAPEAEIPVARALAQRYAGWRTRSAPAGLPAEALDPYQFNRPNAEIIRLGANIPLGGGLVPRVLAPASSTAPAGDPPADILVDDHTLWALKAHSIPGAERCPGTTTVPTQSTSHGTTGSQSASPGTAGFQPALLSASPGTTGSQPALPAQATTPLTPLTLLRLRDCFTPPPILTGSLVLVRLDDQDPASQLRKALALLPDGCPIGIAESGLLGETRAYRMLAAVIAHDFAAAEARQIGTGRRVPICIALPFQRDDLALAAIAGGLLIDGIGDCIYLPGASDPRRLAYTVLQAVKARTTRADYVACPSCGRTQFDLMEVTAQIRDVTNHLDGVTIAIMGCIVNGPGEMADADFGYVGSGPGKIDLYRRKDIVRRNLPFDRARDELIGLIREAGMWKERGEAKTGTAPAPE